MPTPSAAAEDPLLPREIRIHGHAVRYRTAGTGPVLVLVHGITGRASTWREVIGPLAERFTVVAPDLQGHGGSAKPRGDYSLGAFAAGIRDLLTALGHDRFTVVGHSLGGGIALQMAYLFPERCERLVLVGSGGLGRDVNPVLRLASLPGTELTMPMIAPSWGDRPMRMLGRGLHRLGWRAGPDVAEVTMAWLSLTDASARMAFLHTLRGVVDVLGQRVSARDRLYLAKELPVLIVWGEKDHIIPVAHGRWTHEHVPHSRLEVYPDAGHFPHLDDPLRFVAELTAFVDETEPARLDVETLRGRLQHGPSAADTPEAERSPLAA